MKIRNHKIQGVPFRESPNHGDVFDPGLPDTIIIHYTAGASAESSIETLCDPRAKASAHIVVARDGTITQLVPFNVIAWHAGKSSYDGRVGFNRYSIGIEIDNAGRLTKSGNKYYAWFGKAYPEEEVIAAVHRNETELAYWHRYSEEQIQAVFEICSELVDVYKIKMILGHEEISPGRKVDPGPAFPLDKLRERILMRDRYMEDEIAVPLLRNVGMVQASKLNIRSEPLLSASTVAPPLLKGTIVNILQEKLGWYEVKVETRGWVKKEFIKT